MSFASDCDAIPELTGTSRRGLQALNTQDLAHVSRRPATVLTTSIDIDRALRVSQPTAARWDYGVAERRRSSEIVHWIELHPASGGNCIAQMQRKLEWLGAWLHGSPLYRRSTKVFQDALAGGGAGLRILTLRGANAVEGGLPIVVDGKIIGAIGVSGGSAEQDGVVAKAGPDGLAAK